MCANNGNKIHQEGGKGGLLSHFALLYSVPGTKEKLQRSLLNIVTLYIRPSALSLSPPLSRSLSIDRVHRLLQLAQRK